MEVSPCRFGNAPWAGTQGFGMLDDIGAWAFGDFFSGSVPGALGMCLSVDTQSFWDAQWGQCL